jgi:hypothetical protein
VKRVSTAQLVLNLLEQVLVQLVKNVQQAHQLKLHVQMDTTKIMFNSLIAFSALLDISVTALQEQ